LSPTETDQSPPDPVGRASVGGPAVVAIGGGHGLAASLRAIRQFTDNITAVVSVADDGGSSGRLRDLYGVPAPGDIRRCLLALATVDQTVADAFAHRFTQGELAGHVAGNLMLTALTQSGADFIEAIDRMGELLAIQGRVLPNAVSAVRLTAKTAHGELTGQVAIKEAGEVHSISIDSPEVECPPPVLQAVAEADSIIMGPGSLFTSVLAALAVPELAEAVNAAVGERIYVCNLRPEPSETPEYDVARHVEALHDHGVKIDRVLYDPAEIQAGELSISAQPAPLAGVNGMVHDPSLLAAALQHHQKH